MRENNTAMISDMKIANRISYATSHWCIPSLTGILIICRYFWEYQIVKLNYLVVRLYILPYRRVQGATCWAHDLQWLYIYSRVNSVSIYSKHYFRTLPTGSGVSDPSLRWCHAVKTEFEFRALTCINKPCWFRSGITEQLPLAKFQQGAPQKLSRAFSPCPSYL